MTQARLEQMADIYLSAAPDTDIPVWLLLTGIIISLIGLFFILYFLWQYFNDPLTELEHQLKQEKLSSREAAHRLAYLLDLRETKKHKNNQLTRPQIDHLRFQRQPPESSELLALIVRAKYER